MRTRALSIVVSVLAASALSPATAPAPALALAQSDGARGTLRGRVDVTRPLEVPGRRPSVSELAEPRTAAKAGAQPVVVFLEAPEVNDASPLLAGRAVRPGRARMDQRNETFAPAVLAVDRGTTVDFPNSDRTFHNVFSFSRAKRFDLGRYGRGESKPVRFDRAGVVRVFCDIHSHMSAFVLVFNHPYHATVDADGRYQIDGIPAGTYTVHAWQEGASRDARIVTIPASTGPTDLDLLVR